LQHSPYATPFVEAVLIYYPQIKVFDTWQKGDHKEARRLFELILPVMAISNQRIDVSGHFWKYVRVQLFFLCALSPYG